MATERQKFCLEVSKTSVEVECIDWPYKLMKNGYACLSINNQLIYAHRYVCELANGPKPFESAVIAHKCGRSQCVNPHHLRWCSQLENILDKWDHGTMVYGSKCSYAKLSDSDVAKIRETYAAGGVSQRELGLMFGVVQQQICRILQRKRWAHSAD